MLSPLKNEKVLSDDFTAVATNTSAAFYYIFEGKDNEIAILKTLVLLQCHNHFIQYFLCKVLNTGYTHFPKDHVGFLIEL